MHQKMTRPGLSIIAGSGNIPLTVANAARNSGREVHIFGLTDAASTGIEQYPHHWINFGHIGRILSVSRKKNCTDLVIVGAVRRPQMRDLRIDFGAFINMPSLFGWTVGGDDSVLTGIIHFFESKGLKVFGAHEIAPELIAGESIFTRKKPGKVDYTDIEIGLKVIGALGSLDVGQATVVSHKYVLAVEAAEGTDRMLERCKELNKWGKARGRKRSGVLIKCAKPGQDRRIDLPTVGPETVRRASEAGLAGIALAARDVLIVDRDEFVQEANAVGLFVVGIDPTGKATP